MNLNFTDFLKETQNISDDSDSDFYKILDEHLDDYIKNILYEEEEDLISS